MANYTLSARITADAKEFIKGLKDAKNEVSGLQKFAQETGTKFKDFGNKVGEIGKGLTNKITKPAIIAGGAVAGLVGTLGFKRLVGMDEAQAKLKGLGFEGKAVDRIMKDVEGAVTGTTHTMAEGVDAAAGALAAGVKEGAELERYIKLVGDAATGANMPMAEMAQIFNRVQGTGKLTRHELDMIEYRLPGFSQAMADHVGADSLDAFHEMVRAGEVGTDEFLDVMDDFAGGMAEAYAGTWSGMVKNTLANIGIIGEALLDGLFKDGKKAMEKFLDVLRSDELRNWAQETGEKIRETAHRIVEKVMELKQKWDELSPSVQNVIKKVSLFGGAFLLILGPALKVISFLVTGFGNVMIFGSKLISFFKLLGAVIGFITSPVGLVIAAIIAAVALIYIYWEPIKDFFINLWEAIKDAGLLIWENLKEGWQNAKDNLTEAWESLKEFFSELWESIKDLTIAVWDSITGFFNGVVEGIVLAWESTIEFFTGLWDRIIEVFTMAYEWLDEITGGAFGTYIEIIQAAFDTIWGIVESVWGFITDTFGNALDFLKALVTGDFEGMKKAIKNQMENAKELLFNIWDAIKSNIGAKVAEVLSNIKQKFEEIKTNIQNKITEAKNKVIERFNEMVSNVTGKASEIVSTVSNKFEEARKKIIEPVEKARDKIKEVIDKIKGFFSDMKLSIPSIKLPKLPRFTMTGSFSLNPPSVPKLGVQWHAKGGLMTKPTIFGMAGNTMLGGGEAGPEAILPLNSKVLGNIGKGIASTMGKGSQTTINNENNITVHATIRNEQDIDRLTRKLDETLSDLSARRRAALGG